MKPKRFFLLSYYYLPANNGAVSRNTALVRHLVRLGWEMTVVTAWPPATGPIGRAERGPAGERLLRVIDPRFKLFPPPVPGAPGAGNGRRSLWSRLAPAWMKDALADYALIPDEARFWIRPAQAALGTRLRGLDCPVLMTTSGPESAHLVGASLKRRFLERDRPLLWAADFADGWCFESLKRAFYRVGYRPTVERRLEARCIRTADLVTAAMPSLLEDFGRRYGLPDDRLCLVSNGFDGQRVAAVPPAPKPPETFRLVYTGRLSLSGPGRDPEPLVAAALALAEADPLFARHVETVWMGEFTPHEHQQFRRLGARTRCTVLPLGPWEQSIALQKSADVLLLLKSPTRVSSQSSKVFEYLAVGRPILALARADGAAAQVVNRFRAGLCVEPRDVPAITQALTCLWRQYRTGALCGPDAAEVSVYEFSQIAGRLTDRLLALLERVQQTAHR